ncbi:MAG: HNH endonuclease signature motif containing protein [Pseudomonadota bacterium]
MAIRARVFLREPRCAECLRKGHASLAMVVDHIKPLHKGGTDDLDNLEGLCHSCHDAKTRKDMDWKAKPTIGADGWPL